MLGAQVTPDDPRLWCALGDLTSEEGHFETAWERSGRRSTRAQRSLARAAQRDKDHARVPLPFYFSISSTAHLTLGDGANINVLA